MASVSLTRTFSVATLKRANRVRSCEGRREPSPAWCLVGLGSRLDWDAALVWVDARFEYDELRMIALVPKTDTLYYVAFVERGEVQRIVSLRRATRREVKHYVQSI